MKPSVQTIDQYATAYITLTDKLTAFGNWGKLCQELLMDWNTAVRTWLNRRENISSLSWFISDTNLVECVIAESCYQWSFTHTAWSRRDKSYTWHRQHWWWWRWWHHWASSCYPRHCSTIQSRGNWFYSILSTLSLNVIVQKLFISNVCASSLQHFSSSNIFINRKMFLVVKMMSWICSLRDSLLSTEGRCNKWMQTRSALIGPSAPARDHGNQ